MKIGCSVFFRISIENPVTGHQILGHEDDEDGAHAVETEAFCHIIDDDVGDPAGHRGGGYWCGPVFAHRPIVAAC